MEAETSAASDTPVTRKKMIMVAIDESEESFYSLKWALDNLINDPSIIITLINVQIPFTPMVYPAGPGMYVFLLIGSDLLSKKIKNCMQ